MIEPSRVMEQFRLLARLGAEDASEWLPLAESCAARIWRQVRADAELETGMAALEQAAAGLLLYQYTAALSLAAGGSFKLGDLSVSQNGETLKNARALRDELLAAALPLLHMANAFLLQVKEHE